MIIVGFLVKITSEADLGGEFVPLKFYHQYEFINFCSAELPPL